MPDKSGKRWRLTGDEWAHHGARVVAGDLLIHETVEVMPVAEHEAIVAPLLDEENNAGAECSRLEADIYALHATLEDAGLPGAINAASIEERIDRLLDVLEAARELREFCGGKPGHWTIEGKVLKEDGAARAMLSLVDFVNTVGGPDA